MTASKLTKTTIIALALATAVGGTALAAGYGGGHYGNGRMMERHGGGQGNWGGGQGRWGRGETGGQMMGQRMGQRMGQGMDQSENGSIDDKLAFVKDELKITEPQTQAWDDFAEAVRTTTETHEAMRQSMREDVQSGDFQKQALPDRLATQETHMEARLEEIRTVNEALGTLYATLDDGQKKTADEIVLATLDIGMGGKGGQGRHGGPGGQRGPGAAQMHDKRPGQGMMR